jgi:hypothetical protein
MNQEILPYKLIYYKIIYRNKISIEYIIEMNSNSSLENVFKPNLDNKLAYLYQIYAIIDIYKDSMSHEHSEQILENLIYLHTRIVKHHYISDHIILNLGAETKKPILELGREIEKNPIDKINFVLEARKKGSE